MLFWYRSYTYHDKPIMINFMIPFVDAGLIQGLDSNISASIDRSENESYVYINCLFRDESASACVAVHYHRASSTYNLTTLNV